MSKRRSSLDKLTDPHGYKPAFASIDTLEQHVIRDTIKVDFLPDDVVEWLFDREVIDLCERAYTVVAEPYSRQYIAPVIRYSHGAFITVNFNDRKMCIPATGRHRAIEELDDGSAIPTLLYAYTATINQFNDVRAVIFWLQKNATPAAARYYWPVIKGLLPADHPVHEESGRYTEPKGHIGEIMALVRSTSATVASALLCQREEEPKEFNHMSFIVGGRTYGIL